jgi:hypothetical protein
MTDPKKPFINNKNQYSLTEAEKWLADLSRRFGKVDPVLLVLRERDPVGPAAALVEIAKKYNDVVYTILLNDSNTPCFTLAFAKTYHTPEWETFIQSYHFPTPSPQGPSTDINKILLEPTNSVPTAPFHK